MYWGTLDLTHGSQSDCIKGYSNYYTLSQFKTERVPNANNSEPAIYEHPSIVPPFNCNDSSTFSSSSLSLEDESHC